MESNKKLSRNLGFFSVFAIGTGTMIGAGIFVLPGIAITNAGPGAIFSFLLGGLIAIATASSMSELATGMPKAGGTYYFISRVMGPVLGTIMGIGAWLALVFKGSFALAGLAEYAQEIINLPLLVIAIISGLILLYINYRGAESSGSLQNGIVVFLFIILILFIVKSFGSIAYSNFEPFLPFGVSSIFTTTGLIFVSYLGITQLAAVSEEVKNPSKNIPRAFIGSVVAVTILYAGIMFAVNGLIPLESLIGNEVPLIEAGEVLAGSLGGIIIILAGFFATVSTANAAILSSSRFPFAMGRDKLLPDKFVNVHEKYGTPTRAILVTGGVMILLLLFFDVEQLAKLGSTFNVLIFAFINLSTVILRKNKKDWYKPTYRDPLFPYTQIFGIIASLSLIPQLGFLSFIFTVVVFVFGYAWYNFYGKERVRIDTRLLDIIDEEKVPTTIDSKRRVMVSIASPDHERSLLKLASLLGDDIVGLEVHKVAPQTGLSEAKRLYRDDDERRNIFKKELKKELLAEDNDHNYIEIFSHDVSDTIIEQADSEMIELLIMGHHEGEGFKKFIDDVSSKVMLRTRNHLAVLKGSLPEKINDIIIPYGGGHSSDYAVNLAQRISNECDSNITLLRNIHPDMDPGDKRILEEDLLQKVKQISSDKVKHKLIERFSTEDAIIESSTSADLMIIGDTNRRFKLSLVGNMTERIVCHANCPVVLVKRYRPLSKRGIMSYFYKKKKIKKK